MTAFLTKKQRVKVRTKKSFYDEKIKSKTESTKKGYQAVLNNFNEFCMIQYDRSSDQIIEELLTIKGEDQEGALLDVYQLWVNWNIERKITPLSIQNYFSNLKIYLQYRGLKVAEDEIKDNVEFPKIIKDEKYPLKQEEILKILEVAKPHRKSLYLALASSGMRIGEAVQLRKRNLDFSHERIMVKIPANITKTKTGRTTFISSETHDWLKLRLRKIKPDDLIWGTTTRSRSARSAEEEVFRRILVKTGLYEKYDSTTTGKITLHSFRSYFYTKAARHDDNFAQGVLGHTPYMASYGRLTDEEKLQIYLKVESDLLIFDQSKKIAEIEKLKKEKSEMQKKNEENKILRSEMDKVKTDLEKIKQWREIALTYQKKN